MSRNQLPPIRAGLVGLNFGRRLIERQVLRGEGGAFLTIAGVTSLDPGETRQVAQAWGVTGYATTQDMLREPDLDAIVVFTGPVGRAALVRQCVDAGKHVLTTKPFDVDADAAQSVLEHARRCRIVVHTNSPSPLPSPSIEQILRWRVEHDLGRAIAARRDSYDSYDEQPDGTWKDDPRHCPAAPIFRLGIYGINDLLRLLGRAERVQVMATRVRTARPTPDNAMLTIQFVGGALANLFHSFCIRDGQAHTTDLRVHFERGSVHKRLERTPDGPLHTLTLYGGNVRHPLIRRVAVDDSAGGGYGWRAFRDAVRQAAAGDDQTVLWGAPPTLVGDGLRVIDAMRRSEQSGRIEPVP